MNEPRQQTAGLARNDVPTEPTSIEKTLKLFSPYKELLAIIVFFATGALWIFGYFVTKSQFEELKCYTKHNLVLHRETTRLRDAEEAIAEKTKRLDELKERAKSVAASDIDRGDTKALEAQLVKLATKKKLAEDRLSQAEERLENRDCLGEGK